MSVVIIGGGHAGIQAAVSLREQGHAAPITILLADEHVPYQRPPLSKDYMKQELDPAPLHLAEEGQLEGLSISLVHNALVTEIDRDSQVVKTEGGDDYAYTSLILAVGAEPRRPSILGAEAAGIHYLKTLDDAAGLRDGLRENMKVVVVGAGFIGMEFAVAAQKWGCDVTVLEYADRPMGRALSPFLGEWMTERYKDLGITMRFNEGIASFEEENGTVTAAVSTDGNRYPADLVVVGIGVVPNTALAESAGLEVGNGIVVNDRLQTSDPQIYAIGDCAFYPSAHAGNRIRLESVQNAEDQAKHVAAQILGDDSPYTALPWFWSTQGRIRLQMSGIVESTDEYRVIGKATDPTSKFSVLFFRDGRLVAAESVSTPADQTIVRRLMNAGVELTLEQVDEPGFSLREFLRSSVPARASS